MSVQPKVIRLYEYGFQDHSCGPAKVWFMSGYQVPETTAHDKRYWWQETLGG